MGLEQHIAEIRNSIKTGDYVNEAAVSQGIVLRILNALGWPTYDTQVVSPQFGLEGRRVDYALCHPPGKPIAFIEVKSIGQAEGAERQLFEYAFHKGIQLAILTDGQEWNFFLPAEQGDYADRCVYKLDIVERDLNDCTFRLSRYLRHDEVISGDAINAARKDYRDVARERLIQLTLPQAWDQLINDDDARLLELVADQVERLCGYKPNADTVALFLGNNVTSIPQNNPIPPSPPKVSVLAPVDVYRKRGSQPKALGFVLNGKHHPARNASEVLISVLEELTKRDRSFPARFAALPKHGQKRRYLAPNQEDLYPGRPDLAHDHSKRLASGWWVSTNHSRKGILKILRMACDVAHVSYGADLIVELGD